MTPLRGWLRPPGPLLLALFAFTAIAIAALCWFGWRVLEQDRLVENQRRQNRLEEAADRLTESIRGILADTGDRLGAWNASSASAAPPAEVLLRIRGESVSASPAGRLLFYPVEVSLAEADPGLFTQAEQLEFTQAQPAASLPIYERLAASSDLAVRAGAWMRMARVLRNFGRVEQSRSVYRKLAAARGAKVAGVPADLVGQLALAEHGENADALQQGLREGRWQLTRGQFEFYWGESNRLLGRADEPPADALARSEVALSAWEKRKIDFSSRGQEIIWDEGKPYLVFWRGGPETRAVLITSPTLLLSSLVQSRDPAWALLDAAGRTLAGEPREDSRAVVRPPATSGIPWTLSVSEPRAAVRAGLEPQNRFLLMGLGLMVLFLVAATYFMTRAIRRETAIQRMQSDFVSAVSHEFRSPLTSIRHLSEMLALGRVPSEERRQVYYQTLEREAGRLHRLVESLLNFGKMEAGARKYRFEELDVAALARRVASEFDPQLAAEDRRIVMSGAATQCIIDADPEAMGVALRNLIDNALKYSPKEPVVWVDWWLERGAVALRVRDQGPGIPESERKAIFQKFFRGSAALATNAKGSGVGLAMVQHIIAAHGGEVAVQSQPGKGSTFTVTLPAAECLRHPRSRLAAEELGENA